MRFAFALCVVFGSAALSRAQSDSVIVQSPKKDAEVAVVDTVSGICAVKGAVPVIFVKPLDGEKWFAQAAATRDGAKFKCTKTHFGIRDTKPGTRFKIVVVAIPENKVKGFSEGDTFDSLPDEYPASEPIIVKR